MNTACIVGGGLAGLLAAYTLSQKGFVINLFEQRSSFFLPPALRGCTRNDAQFLHLLNTLDVSFVVYPYYHETPMFPYEERLAHLRCRPVPFSTTFKELYIQTFGEHDYALFRHAVPSASSYEEADAGWGLFYFRFPHEHGFEFEFSTDDLIHALISKFKNVRMFLNTCVDDIRPKEKTVCVKDKAYTYDTLVITSYDVAKRVCPWLHKAVHKVPVYSIDVLDHVPHTQRATVQLSNTLESVVPFGTSSLRIVSLDRSILKCSISTIRAFLKRPNAVLVDCNMFLNEHSILKKHPRSFADIAETVRFLQTPQKSIYIVGSFASLFPNTWEGYVESVNILNKI